MYVVSRSVTTPSPAAAVPHPGLSASSRPGARAVVALTILESLRHIDAPAEEGIESHRELTVKRLGTSGTVAAQIERYRHLAAQGKRVEHQEVAALFRLVCRRTDAGLVLADAGRRVGGRVTRGLSRALLPLLPRFLRRRVAFGMARRAARGLLDASLSRAHGRIVTVMADPPSASATADGSACGFYGSALAEILRALTDFDGALSHALCRARGDDRCEWRVAE